MSILNELPKKSYISFKEQGIRWAQEAVHCSKTLALFVIIHACTGLMKKTRTERKYEQENKVIGFWKIYIKDECEKS